jgi:divalent metal cation (Fe/Co/Zn/Cd) transporter
VSAEHLSLEEANRVKARAAYVSIISNSLLIGFKLTVGIISGSVGIISEALHSGSDLIAAVIAFFAVCGD